MADHLCVVCGKLRATQKHTKCESTLKAMTTEQRTNFLKNLSDEVIALQYRNVDIDPAVGQAISKAANDKDNITKC